MSWRISRSAGARCVSAALLLAALAACTSDGKPPVVAAIDDRLHTMAAPAEARPAAPVEPVETTASDEPTITARLTPPATPAPSTAPAPTPPPRAEPPAPAEPSPPAKPPPIELAGLDGDEVAELLGRPHHVWREPPAAVWQYRATECVLHVFFYPAAGARLAVVHVTRRRPGSPARPTNGAIDPASSDFTDELCRRVEAAG